MNAPVSGGSATGPSDVKRLRSEFGWIVEPGERGGVRLRMRAARRGCMTGLGFGR